MPSSKPVDSNEVLARSLSTAKSGALIGRASLITIRGRVLCMDVGLEDEEELGGDGRLNAVRKCGSCGVSGLSQASGVPGVGETGVRWMLGALS